MVSWNSPSATAPSPKKHAVTRSRPLHPVGQRQPDGERQAAADDGVAAVEAGRGVEQVHRAAAAAAAALDPAVHLGHDRVGMGTPRARAWPCSRYVATTASSAPSAPITPTGDRLLTDVQVQEAADLRPLYSSTQRLLEPADAHHLRGQQPIRRLARCAVRATVGCQWRSRASRVDGDRPRAGPARGP